MKSRSKLSKNCSMHGKNHEISGPYNFWTPVKSNIPDVWNENCWTFFGSKIEVGGACPPGTPSGYASVYNPKSKIHDTHDLLFEILLNKEYTSMTDREDFEDLEEGIANNFKILANIVHTNFTTTH